MSYEIAWCKDSFAFLASLADQAVDVIITDPPYSAHVHANMTSGTAIKKLVDGGGHGGIPKIDLPFAPLTSHLFARQMVRVARRWVVTFCAVEDFGKYQEVFRREHTNNKDEIEVTYPEYLRGGIWYKPNSMGQLTGDRPAAAYEGIAIMHRATKKVWNGRGSYAHWVTDSDEFPSEESYFVCNGTRGEKARHPNQKPENLCLELVAKFSNRGETVLDPFCGSGRIGEACMALGRNYIGLDSDPHWVTQAEIRVGSMFRQNWGALTDDACLKLCAAPRPAKLGSAPSPP